MMSKTQMGKKCFNNLDENRDDFIYPDRRKKYGEVKLDPPKKTSLWLLSKREDYTRNKENL